MHSLHQREAMVGEMAEGRKSSLVFFKASSKACREVLSSIFPWCWVWRLPMLSIWRSLQSTVGLTLGL